MWFMSEGKAAFAAGAAKRLVSPRARLTAPGIALELLLLCSSVCTGSSMHYQQWY